MRQNVLKLSTSSFVSDPQVDRQSVLSLLACAPIPPLTSTGKVHGHNAANFSPPTDLSASSHSRWSQKAPY